MMSTSPHVRLIALARDGDIGALSRLLVAAQPDIRRYARKVCKTADVDDAVQDALCLLHRRIGGLRLISAFSSWIFAIVRRECVRLARRTLQSAATVESIENDLRFATRPDAELRLDLAAAIDALPQPYRVVIVLRDIEELTINEIAGHLGATREAVKARLHRGRVLVREYLER